MLFRPFALPVIALSVVGAAPPAANLGTAIAECHGVYDSAKLIPPARMRLGLDVTGITVFGAPAKYLLSNFSDEWDEEIFKYTAGVDTDLATLRAKALSFHQAKACTEQVATPGKRSCGFTIAAPRSGKKFRALHYKIEERGTGSAAICTLRLL